MISEMPIKKKYENYYFLGAIGLFLLWFILFSFRPNSRECLIFFRKFEDLFADFFNVLRYVSERDVYFNEVNGLGQKEYLPLAYMIFYPFSRFDDYARMSLADCWHSQWGMFTCFLFLFINLILLLHSLLALCKKYSVDEKIAYALFCSNVILLSIERANIVFLSAVFLNYFLVFYDSQNARERLFACFALAFSATLKIYPVLFILLYLPKKRYKEFFTTVIMGLLLAFLPFLFFKQGFANIPQLVKNVLVASNTGFFTAYGGCFSPLVFDACRFLGMNENVSMMFVGLSRYFVILLTLISLALFFIHHDSLKRWDKLTLLLFPFLYLPSTNRRYCGLFIFSLVILYFATLPERKKASNILFLVLFLIAFTPLEFFESGLNSLIHQRIIFFICAVSLFSRTRFICNEFFLRKKETF
ncbi:MAG: glycosyltransferase 87 family protein [Clostridiales bacterium]|nr:glycosyltransferase 87 family protein [Clostridiales bacterium]